MVSHNVRDADDTSIIDRLSASRVLVDTPKFWQQLNKLVDRGEISRKTYDAQVAESLGESNDDLLSRTHGGKD